MKLGVIQEGPLQGKKIVLGDTLPPNEGLIEKGSFLNGAPMFAKHCLIHGQEIDDKCGEEH